MGKTIVMFDLFGTILDDVKIDFGKGMDYIYERFFKDFCTREVFDVCDKEYLEYFRARQHENYEVCFAKEEIPMLCGKVGREEFELSPEDEWIMADIVNEETVFDDVHRMLETFANAGIPMYVLSNSTFRRGVLCKLLEKHDVLRYFEYVWSSADFGKRKPDRSFFDQAVETILLTHQEARREDIFFIGDNYNYDAFGGFNAGLNATWLNRPDLPGACGHPVNVVKNMDDFTEYVLSYGKNGLKTDSGVKK